jgi:hypothetical protein
LAANAKITAQIIDTDGDGVPDNRDNCPATYNPEKIACEFVQGNNYEIYSMNADGSNKINLTNNGAIEIQPSFSRNGSKIVFTSERAGDQEIYMMNAHGFNPIQLTDSGGNSSPEFAPVVILRKRYGAHCLRLNSIKPQPIGANYGDCRDDQK